MHHALVRKITMHFVCQFSLDSNFMKFILAFLLFLTIPIHPITSTLHPQSLKGSRPPDKGRAFSANTPKKATSRKLASFFPVLNDPMHITAESAALAATGVLGGVVSYFANKSGDRVDELIKSAKQGVFTNRNLAIDAKTQRHEIMEKLTEEVRKAEEQFRQSEHELNMEMMSIMIPLQNAITENANKNLRI
jgi:hypothetical protein